MGFSIISWLVCALITIFIPVCPVDAKDVGIYEFIFDVTSLLRANEDFYKKYGVDDPDVGKLFDEAREYLNCIDRPECKNLFGETIKSIQTKITNNLTTKEAANSDSSGTKLGTQVIIILTSALMGTNTVNPGRILFED